MLRSETAQKSFEKRLSHIEDELVSIKKDCENEMRPVKLSYRQAQGRLYPCIGRTSRNVTEYSMVLPGNLNLERRTLENFREKSREDIEDLKARTVRLERNAQILSSRMQTSKNSVESILSTIQEWAGTTDETISKLQKDGAHTLALLEHVQGVKSRPRSQLQHFLIFAKLGTVMVDLSCHLRLGALLCLPLLSQSSLHWATSIRGCHSLKKSTTGPTLGRLRSQV